MKNNKKRNKKKRDEKTINEIKYCSHLKTGDFFLLLAVFTGRLKDSDDDDDRKKAGKLKRASQVQFQSWHAGNRNHAIQLTSTFGLTTFLLSAYFYFLFLCAAAASVAAYCLFLDGLNQALQRSPS